MIPTWVPGMVAQCQVLVTNLYLNLCKLPRKILTGVCSGLPAISTDVRPLAAKAAAHLIRVSGRTVNNIVQRVKNAGWTVAVQVSQDAEDQDSESATPVQGQRSREEILRLLIREALHCSAHGLADDFYIQSVARMQLCGLDVGDKYVSKKFVRMVEFCCAKQLEYFQADMLARRLPGLSVVSPVSIAFDGISIGDTLFSRAESFVVSVLSSLNATTGRLFPQLLASPSSGLFHDGPSQAELVMQSLSQHQALLTKESLRGRMLAVIGGDGAICRGGPDMRHSSTGAGNLLSQQVYPDLESSHHHVEWEKFHRSEAALRQAIGASEYAKELFALAKALSQQFAFGAGRILLRRPMA